MSDQIITDSQKLDRIIELLEKQESRARWGMFWKFFWIFVVVILPMYLSYKLLSSFDLSGMMSGLQNVSNLSSGASSATSQLEGVDLSKALELLNNR